MAVIKCKSCGANLNVGAGKRTITCEYCGTVQTLFDDDSQNWEERNEEINLLKRAFLALEDGEFEKADGFCEQVLNHNPENAQAYLGKLLAEFKLQKWEALREWKDLIDVNTNHNCKRILQFAEEPLRSEFCKILAWNKEQCYRLVMERIQRDDRNYTEILELLVKLNGYKDTEKWIKEYQEKKEKQDNYGCLGWLFIIILGSVWIYFMFR